MQRSNLYFELVGFADSLDEHVPASDVVTALRELATLIETEGLER